MRPKKFKILTYRKGYHILEGPEASLEEKAEWYVEDSAYVKTTNLLRKVADTEGDLAGEAWKLLKDLGEYYD